MRAGSKQKPEPIRLCSPLKSLPWDIAQDEFGTKGADFIGTMGKLLLQTAKSELNGQTVDYNRDTGTLPPNLAKSEFQGQLIDST
jgi:hypothetical protein